MDQTLNGREKRKGLRKQCQDPVDWRHSGLPGSRSGFLIEQSEDGLAFGCRGTAPPIVGSLIEVRVADGWGRQAEECAIVRHASVAHEGLCIVGVEKYRSRPFPPAASAAGAHHEPKSRPLITSDAFLRGCRVRTRTLRVAVGASARPGEPLSWGRLVETLIGCVRDRCGEMRGCANGAATA
ncbi:MAG: hypothetical protein JNK58_07700 [Phycisphaerae bacterium]|nr:hypothetical protein [Phycisphaerae bacterium]